MGGFSSDEYQDQPNQLIGDGQREENIPVQEDSLKEYTDHWGWIRWHFYMCLGIMYLGMVFTNWTVTTNLIGQQLEGNSFVFCLKAINSWFMALIYIWTMIAPRLFPDRNFTVE